MAFVKGQSGNPSGRPKMDPAIKAMFEAKGPDAFNVISKHLEAEDPKVALQAAQIILDRAYGKVAQPIEGGENPVQMEQTIIVTGVPRPQDLNASD